MVRASKTTTDSAPAPKAKTSKKAAAAAPPAAPVNEVKLTPAAEPAAPVVETPSIIVKMAEFSSKLQQLAGLFVTVKSDYKTLEKAMAREMKIAAKASSKKRKSNTERKPSGFTKPTRISDEMANFLGVAHGTEMARTAVSKEIHNYVEKHNLKQKDNGRYFRADAKLTKLLNYHYKGDDKKLMLGYFNLQKYMKHHFQKAGDAVSV